MLAAPPMGDVTAVATLALAAITLALAAATVALVLVTRAGTARARADSRAELDVLKRQVASAYRPLLVDVLITAPAPDDMGARYDVSRGEGPNGTVRYPGPVIVTTLPGLEPRLVDPRSAFVLFEAGQIFLSVPLRNVGRGLAVIEGGRVELSGPLVGPHKDGAIQREHVPVGETTRVDLVVTYRTEQGSDLAAEVGMHGVTWQLTVPYCDFAGGQRTIVRLHIVCRGDDVNGPWVIERVEQESAHPEEESPHDEHAPAPSDKTGESPKAPPSTQIDPRRHRLDVKNEPVTDVWGNPNRPGRRRR